MIYKKVKDDKIFLLNKISYFMFLYFLDFNIYILFYAKICHKCISNCFISLTLNLKVAGPILVSINAPFCREFHSCLKIQIPYERISTLKYPISGLKTVFHEFLIYYYFDRLFHPF